MHKFYRVIKIDHSLILIHLARNNKPRGPGFWKLNTSFLLDSYFIELIKKTIDEVAIENRNNVPEEDIVSVLYCNVINSFFN